MAELVVPGVDGRSDFEDLRRRNLLQRPATIHEAAAKKPAVLVVFDLLAVGDEDLRCCLYWSDVGGCISTTSPLPASSWLTMSKPTAMHYSAW